MFLEYVYCTKAEQPENIVVASYALVKQEKKEGTRQKMIIADYIFRQCTTAPLQKKKKVKVKLFTYGP